MFLPVLSVDAVLFSGMTFVEAFFFLFGCALLTTLKAYNSSLNTTFMLLQAPSLLGGILFSVCVSIYHL
jgi:hypothetical protein